MHAHRFRKTIARLIALAVIGAPKILMDLFNHRQIGMTMHYILSDPLIRAEMLEVAKANTLLLAKNVIKTTDEMGGPAAPVVKAAVARERLRMGSDFDESTVESLAESFTLNGKYWQYVRPGVVCTKGPLVAGACTPNTAMPEPSRCRSNCDHRLEESFLRQDVDETLAECVSNLENALLAEDTFAIEMWKGQIVANIKRFPSLEEKWSTNPIAASIFNEAFERQND